MSKPTFKVIHIESGLILTVYKHSDGSYIDFADCETTYQKKELEFSKKK